MWIFFSWWSTGLLSSVKPTELPPSVQGLDSPENVCSFTAKPTELRILFLDLILQKMFAPPPQNQQNFLFQFKNQILQAMFALSPLNQQIFFFQFKNQILQAMFALPPLNQQNFRIQLTDLILLEMFAHPPLNNRINQPV